MRTSLLISEMQPERQQSAEPAQFTERLKRNPWVLGEKMRDLEVTLIWCFSVFAQFQVNKWSTVSCALAYRHHEAELGGLMWCWELLLLFAGRGGSDPERCWAYAIPLDSAASALSAALEMHTTVNVGKGCCLLELCISLLLKYMPWMFRSYFYMPLTIFK